MELDVATAPEARTRSPIAAARSINSGASAHRPCDSASLADPARDLDGLLGYPLAMVAGGSVAQRAAGRARPDPVTAPLSQAIDPLSGIEPRARHIGRQHDIGLER
jgi:hypothetical protein